MATFKRAVQPYCRGCGKHIPKKTNWHHIKSQDARKDNGPLNKAEAQLLTDHALCCSAM